MSLRRKKSWFSHKLAMIYHNMLLRCYNKKPRKQEKSYITKCISVCDEWINNPDTFEEWALTHGYRDGLSIDRIDSNKNYCPENCRFIPPHDNYKWTSKSHAILVNGITDTLCGWAQRLNVAVGTLQYHLRKNKLHDYIQYVLSHNSKPKQGKIISVNGIQHTHSEWGTILGYSDGSYIGQYRKQHGLEATINFIQNKLQQATIEKQTAEQEAERRVIEAKGKAEAARLEAEGIAAANDLIRNSLSAELVRQHAIDKWDGKMPQVNGNGAMLFNIPIGER